MRRIVVGCLALAALWTGALFVGAATVPVYRGVSTTMTAAGEELTETTTATLVQENGSWIFVLLAVPAAAVLGTALLLALEPRHPRARWAAWLPVGLVGVLTVLGMLTIGIYLLPVVALLGTAVLIVTLDPTGSERPA